MSYFEWHPYVPVAEKRRQAQRKLVKLRKQGQPVAPVTIEGRTIAKTFWGKSWCANLERYSDYATRIPRGRTYARNGSVLDLQIAKGEIVAMVAGSSLYKIKITIAPVKAAHWKAICRDCADMCKHVAAALYGVGARLDEKPQLLFVLRGVDENELLANAGQDLALATAAPRAARLLDDSDVAALFGLEMAESATSDAVIPAAPKRDPRLGTLNGRKTPAVKKVPAAKKIKSPHAAG